MNFKEFWNTQELDKYRTTEDYCLATWNECKSNVLNILRQNICLPLNFGDSNMETRDDEYIDIDVIEKIEKL